MQFRLQQHTGQVARDADHDWQPQTRAIFVPKQWEGAFEQWKKNDTTERGAGEAFMMTGFYMSNNPMAAIMTGAMSASTFGLGTAAALFQNGALIGALAHELRPVNRIPHLFIWVSPHGVTEISGLLVASGAGFVMAYALINPGRRRRGEALRVAGKDAIVLLATGTCMMFIAAPIEGFFSFNPRVPDGAKIAFAIMSAIAWSLFWTQIGKAPEPVPD